MRLPIMLALAAGVALAQSPKTEKLWPDGAPGALGAAPEDTPELTIYLPAKPNGTGVLVCPGGGYRGLAMDHEGKQIAEWYNSLGAAAFVLKYRLGPKYHHPAMLDDAKQGIRTIRARAAEFGVKPDRIGVMGFSAGGHLASTLSTHFGPGERPDFAVLCYPVISFTTRYTHTGSRLNLLGEKPDPKLVEDLSNELAVTKYTPPTFLFHTDNDAGVPPQNSILYYMALKGAGVPAELHIYAEGRHGVGLAPKDPVLSSWPARLKDWLRVKGFLPAE
jgi:acetyl esterase/lipase